MGNKPCSALLKNVLAMGTDWPFGERTIIDDKSYRDGLRRVVVEPVIWIM